MGGTGGSSVWGECTGEIAGTGSLGLRRKKDSLLFFLLASER
jgi:hypothetical protein